MPASYLLIVRRETPSACPRSPRERDRCSRRSAEHVAVDVHVQAAGRGVDERGHVLDEVVVEGLGVERRNPVAEVDCAAFELGVAPALADDQREAPEVERDQVEVPRDLLGDVVDRARDLYDQEQVRALGYEIERAWAEVAPLRAGEACHQEHADRLVHEPFLHHRT